MNFYSDAKLIVAHSIFRINGSWIVVPWTIVETFQQCIIFFPLVVAVCVFFFHALWVFPCHFHFIFNTREMHDEWIVSESFFEKYFSISHSSHSLARSFSLEIWHFNKKKNTETNITIRIEVFNMQVLEWKWRLGRREIESHRRSSMHVENKN